MQLPNYRLLDQVSLALERGNKSVLTKVQNNRIHGLGPLIETSILCRVHPAIGSLFPLCETRQVADALLAGQAQPLRVICGSNGLEQWGILRFRDATVQEMTNPLHSFQLETQKALHFRKKVSNGKARICGAIREMVDNIYDHSGAPNTGVVAFLGSSDSFEVSVGDAGIGILASLRSNPTFAFLQDAGTAMSLALKDGNSRYGPAQDRGYGFGTLFRALNTLDAQLRFRSGDYALEITGRNPHISQKAHLQGFIVSLKLAL